MKTLGMYILNGHAAIPCEDLMEWGAWLETADLHVACTTHGDVEVSTIFLGIDHSFGEADSPVLFETMIFGGGRDGYKKHYSTWEEAEKGHEEACTLAFVLKLALS